ncbi:MULTISPECIES: hypothetical protein [unclassified Microbulbifer]|uniref:DUF2383 domain-containing protein n=1 Tax=Microbulbifer spongiae TaxID=2944933 RepID=A0ABY9E8W3_9GAMM|nr:MULTISPECIES: hypothetical protein [unclassified Microbulbifer]MDP5211164.1 hypothetical protein [Microbulbifer sp. 2205BS26-8]WKD48391.1 hypothetical protein M8T91_10635 [Microbulbifer sp. MI-G]
MRYKTVEEVIQEGRDFHAKLALQYEEYEQLATNKRVELLLDQLRRREDSMKHSLENFHADLPPGALHTWVQFAPEGREKEFLQRLRCIDIDSLDDIAKFALDIEIYLADQYRDLSQGAETPSAREAFERLRQLEELEEHTLSMNLFNLRDY